MSSAGGRFFDIYRSNGNEGEGLGQSADNGGSSNEIIRADTENAQMTPGSSVEPHRAFTTLEPIPSHQTISDASQAFGTVDTQAVGHNTPYPSTSSALSVPNITDEEWATATLQRSDRIGYYRRLFKEGKVKEGLKELTEDPYAPTMVQITGDIRLVDLDDEFKRILKQQSNQS